MFAFWLHVMFVDSLDFGDFLVLNKFYGLVLVNNVIKYHFFKYFCAWPNADTDLNAYNG